MLFPECNIFIDGGGNDCRGIKNYLNNFPKFDKIYAFEPNPYFRDSYKDSGIILIEKAIWIKDGKFPFYLSKDKKHVSSSLIGSKLCRVEGKLIPFFEAMPIEVECIKFSDWIKKNIKKNHTLTLKLDIEGSEYEVLWDLIETKTIRLVTTLYVEFHQQVRNLDQKDHNKLIAALNKEGVFPHHWD